MKNVEGKHFSVVADVAVFFDADLFFVIFKKCLFDFFYKLFEFNFFQF